MSESQISSRSSRSSYYRSQSQQESPQPSLLTRHSVPSPLAKAHYDIIAAATTAQKDHQKAGIARIKTSGKAMVRALEAAAENDGYESDELNLRPAVPVIKSQVCLHLFP